MPEGSKHALPPAFFPRAEESNTDGKIYSTALIKQTIELWQPRYHVEITNARAIEILENTTGFLDILGEWRKAENEN